MAADVVTLPINGGLFKPPTTRLVEPPPNATTLISALLPLTSNLPVTDFKRQNLENYILGQKGRAGVGVAPGSAVANKNRVLTENRVFGGDRSLVTSNRYTITSMIRKGYFNLVRYLLERGAQPNHVNMKDEPTGRTALIYCTFIKEDKWAINVAQTLIEYGADLKQKDANGLNVFHYCCAFGRTHLLEFLLNSLDFDLTQVTDLNGNTCLHYAMWNHDIALIDLLLKTLKAKHFYEYSPDKIELTNKLGLKPTDLEEESTEVSSKSQGTTFLRYKGTNTLEECKKYVRDFTAVVKREHMIRVEKERQDKLLKQQLLSTNRKRLSKIKINDQVSVRKVNGAKGSSAQLTRKSSKASSDTPSRKKSNSKSGSKLDENLDEANMDYNEDDVFQEIRELTTLGSSSTTTTTTEYVDYVKTMKPSTPTLPRPPSGSSTTPVFKTEVRDLSHEKSPQDLRSKSAKPSSTSQAKKSSTSSSTNNRDAKSPNAKLKPSADSSDKTARVFFTALAATKAIKAFKTIGLDKGMRSFVIDDRPGSAKLLKLRPKTAPMALSTNFGASIDKEKVKLLTKKSLSFICFRDFHSNMITYNDLFFAREHLLQSALVNEEQRSSQQMGRVLSSKTARAKSALNSASSYHSNTDLSALISSATGSEGSQAAQILHSGDDLTFDSDRISVTPLHMTNREHYHDHYSSRRRKPKLTVAEANKSRLSLLNTDWKDNLTSMYKELETNLSPSYRKTIKPPVSNKVIRPLNPAEQAAKAQPTSRKMSNTKRGSMMSSNSSMSTTHNNPFGAGADAFNDAKTTSISDSLSMRKKT